jgi:two-component system NarL family sensor kinase
VASPTWTHFLTEHHGWPFKDSLREMAIYAGCLAAFIADLFSANTLAFGVFYSPLIVTAVFHRDKRAVWILTAIACLMVIVGSLFPIVVSDVSELVENRALSICALLATAAFTWHARRIQEQLTEQTRRAEAAESIKTEVLTNLSQEIRAPLYSMIGVLELVATDSRPDQKAALGMVRSAGRRLVMTVDNLVDLTQFEGQPLQAEPIDLGQLLRQTAEANRQDALGRQIGLTVTIPDGEDCIVHVNPWAVRRILENKITDAITYTPPGGRIEVTTESEQGYCTAVIAASGAWPPVALQTASDPNRALLIPSVMGLALSQRLARATDARLVFSTGPGEGTTVRLRLPAGTAARFQEPTARTPA